MKTSASMKYDGIRPENIRADLPQFSHCQVIDIVRQSCENEWFDNYKQTIHPTAAKQGGPGGSTVGMLANASF